jgi:hypothetical protein
MNIAWISSIVLPLCLLALAPYANGQDTFTLSGTVKSAETGEALIGVYIIVKDLKNTGAASNAYGFYSLTLPGGRYVLQVQSMGFHVLVDTLLLDHNTVRNFSLATEVIKVGEVVVTGERTDRNVTSTEMSTAKIAMTDVKVMPALLGERDILKTIQLLPGVKAAGEGNTGFFARGGGIDQNLVMLDEAPIYNPSHVLGFVSVFNADAIKDVKLMTGDIPAEYGGRLSSVLDIRSNDGNMREFSGAVGIGLLAARATVQGPIVRDEGSYIVSARRTYADLFLRLSTDTTINRTGLYFYDINAKANYTLGENDRVFVAGYFGRDNFNYPNVVSFDWGNATATARWNHLFSGQFFSNTTVTFSDYSYTNGVGVTTNQYEITSGIKDVNGKIDLQYFVSANNSVKFGINAIYHTFHPGAVTAGPTSTVNIASLADQYALETAGYASHQTEIVPGFSLDYGVRVSAFRLLGPGHAYTYDEYGDISSKTEYPSGANIVTYTGVEPRIAMKLLLDPSSSIKAAYNRTAQYLHLLSNSTVANPSDLWVPSTSNVKPQYADQYALGYFRNFNDNEFETSVELYYKNMQNQIEYRNGADLQLNPLVEAQLVYGRGWSYGAEFLLRKHTGPVSGWLTYTLSRTMEQFPEINGGEAFPARQDQTHHVSLVVVYEYSPTWTFSAVWVYNTGAAVTFPAGNYWIDGRLVPYYTTRNGYRMPAYHRLDLSATWKLGDHASLNFSIYNAYNRMNPYAIYFRQMKSDPTKTEAVQITLFPFIPSVTYNLTF